MNAVFYSSAGGTAKQYARWLSDRRDADVFDLSEAKVSLMRRYQVLVFILSIYDGQMRGLDVVQRRYTTLKKHPVYDSDDTWDAEDTGRGRIRAAILAVGASTLEQAQESGQLLLPAALQDLPVYYARGRFQPEKMAEREKQLLAIYRKALESGREEAVPAWMRDLLKHNVSADFSDPVYLEPILDLIDGRG